MDVYLIRHAHAGQRTFGSHDKYRPLSEEGHRQAVELAEFFSASSLSAAYSSPATRCSQTIEPSAHAAGLTVVEHDDLWEGAWLDDVMTVIDHACQSSVESGGVAICSHGNLIPAVVEQLARQGVPVSGRGCERASIWMLRRDRGAWVQAQYLTPRSAYRY